MTQLISVIENKNKLLQAFKQYSLEFLTDVCRGDLSELTQFEARRAQCLDAIFSGEKLISQIIKNLSEQEKTSNLINQIEVKTRKTDQILAEIIDLDSQIIGKLHQEKDQLKDLLIDFNRSEKLVRKFKSSWMPLSGEKLDGSL